LVLQDPGPKELFTKIHKKKILKTAFPALAKFDTDVKNE